MLLNLLFLALPSLPPCSRRLKPRDVEWSAGNGVVWLAPAHSDTLTVSCARAILALRLLVPHHKTPILCAHHPSSGPPPPRVPRYPEEGEPAGEVTFPQAPIGQGKARGHASPQTDFSVPSGSSGQGGAPSQGTHPNHYPHSPAQGSGENAAGYHSHLLVALLLIYWPHGLHH